MSKLRLLQISDCHLSAEPHADYRGQSPDQNLEQFSAAVHAWQPDWLILTGDLSEDGSSASYHRLAVWLSCFAVPVAWLPGNHDDRAQMEPIFDAAGFRSGPLLRVGGWQLALLDSAWPGRPEGELDQQRLAVLDQLDSAVPSAVFVHHHPLPVAPWIDRVSLEQPERLWQKLKGVSSLRFVAFGHVHQRFRTRYKLADSFEIECMAAPSTAANSFPASERFTPEPAGPMARWFELASNGSYKTGFLGLAG